MSRLYQQMGSDTNKGRRTQTGNNHLFYEAFYGSKTNSKTAVRIWIDYEEGREMPYIRIDLPEGIDLYLNQE